MGGSAFTSAPYLLNTPRMPPAVYHRIKSACHACLRELYVFVASPIEGPGKEDHGDVDIIVFLEQQAAAVAASGPEAGQSQPQFGHEQLARIAAALGAEHIIYLKPHLTEANMAIPWPEEEEGEEEQDPTDGAPQTKGHHVQVDVRIAQSLAELQWWLFRHAHGDFWQLAGSTIRPLGLTIDEEALWVRVPEIEARDRKRSKVFLSADPDEVLRFLGYKGWDADTGSEEKVADADDNNNSNSNDRPDVDGQSDSRSIADDDDTRLRRVWERPFDTTEALFDYVATSRWFWVPPPRRPEEEGSQPSESVLLRSNDRRRLKQRRVYAQWAERYLPSLSLRTTPSSPPTPNAAGLSSFDALALPDKRLAVREAAFERWPAARDGYAGRLEAFRAQAEAAEQQRRILACIRETVAGFGEGESWSGVAVGALKKVVFSADASFGAVPAAPLRDERGLVDVAEAERFVREAGLGVGRRAWEIMCARGRNAVGEKARKRAMLAEGQSLGPRVEVQEAKKIKSDAGALEHGAHVERHGGGLVQGDEGPGA